jgi:alpha-L-fucosidase
VLPEVDVVHLQKFNRHVSAMLSEDIARGAKVTASNERGGSRQFGAGNLTDGKDNSYWATDDAVTAAEFVVTLPKLREISVIKLAEHIALGQRVDSFKVDVRVDGKWVPWVEGFQVSAQRILRGTPVVTDAIRVAVKASACPCLTSVSIYREPHV